MNNNTSFINIICLINVFVFLIVAIGCNEISKQKQPEPRTTHCYVIAALETIEGRKLPESGTFIDVFNKYNIDEDLEMYRTTTFTKEEIESYLNQGHRIAITYQKEGTTYHIEYIEDVGAMENKTIEEVHVVGYFDDFPWQEE